MNTLSIPACCVPIRHPAPILVAGPTGSGKTQFLTRALLTNLIQPAPQRIIWVFGEWQPAYDEVKSKYPEVEFVKNFDDNLYDTLSPDKRNLLILDDQMSNEAVRDSNDLTKYFTNGSHHRNSTVVYVVQNIFDKGKAMRTLSLNSHYLVLFKNARDKSQIRALAAQMYPQNAKFLVQSFEDATREPFEHMLLDLKPDTPEALRVRARTFDANPVVYVPHPDSNGLLSSL